MLDVLVRLLTPLRRFGVNAEATAFVTVLSSFGWRPSAGAPDAESLAVSSGAAFATIVVAQTATALACRSWSRPGWRVPLRTNPLLLTALALSPAIAAVLLYVAPFARLLGHAPPTEIGWLVALFSFPVVLAVDACHKRWLRRRSMRVLSESEGRAL